MIIDSIGNNVSMDYFGQVTGPCPRYISYKFEDTQYNLTPTKTRYFAIIFTRLTNPHGVHLRLCQM